MKLLVRVVVVLSLVVGQASALAAGPALVIDVHVHGVRSDAGELVVVLYGDNPDDFLKKGRRLARERVAARSGSVDVAVPVPGSGTYAVAVYHDENGNRKLDTSLIGLPVEGVGLSNNPVVRFRPPRLGDAAFDVGGEPAAVDITLRY